MSDTQEHPDWFRGHDGKWYPKEQLPSRSHVAEPEPPRDRRWLLPAAFFVAVAAIVVFAVVRSMDDEPNTVATPNATAVATAQPETVLDEVFPDRPSVVADRPTPDPTRAGDAASALSVVETAWVRSAFDDLDFVVVIRNDADVTFGNVNIDAVFVDADGAELAREPFSYPVVPAGGDVVLSGLRPIDPDAVDTIRVETSARGTLRGTAATPEVLATTWEQDPAGTVTLSGSVVAATPVEFVSVVGVLRSDDGAFLGTAFAFVDAVTDEPRAFEAVGFPDGDVASVDVYVSG
ncbi:MAG: hypothetical protein AAF480_13230 [Actinomycetota bacterium]